MKRFLALVVAVVAVMLGVGLQTHPYWVFKVPRVGFVLYAMVGGAVPPYFQPDIFHKQFQDQWARPGDVFVAVPAKSGTTWMMNTLHHIRAKGQPQPFRDIYEEVRWPELLYYPGQGMAERIALLNRVSKKYPFSIYKTHFGPKKLFLRDDAKYIVAVRNVVDVAASLYSFLRNHDKEFAKMWGGFPPGAGEEEQPGDMAKFEHFFLVDSGNGKPMLDAVVLECLEEFWPLRNRPNVHFLHYNDRLRNDSEEIRKIAHFIGWELTQQEVERVAEKNTFAVMKKEHQKFSPGHIFEEFAERGLVSKTLKTMLTELVNVGAKRNGESELNKQFVDRILSRVEKRFGKEIAHWINHGGVLPNAELPV
ncbi:hypothetical protein BASA81_002150 [Batrachochytrium salamandrivorans]|nr:hypothetical protein BASA81_002150 [Batrachochytrium salamandrivorans]